MQNLLSNALKFGRGGTAVTVTVTCTPASVLAATKGRQGGDSAARGESGRSRCPLALPRVRPRETSGNALSGPSGGAAATLSGAQRSAKVAPGPTGRPPSASAAASLHASATGGVIAESGALANAGPSTPSTSNQPKTPLMSRVASRSSSPAGTGTGTGSGSSAQSSTAPSGSTGMTSASGHSLRTPSRQFSKSPSSEQGASSDDEFCAPEVIYSISVCEWHSRQQTRILAHLVH